MLLLPPFLKIVMDIYGQVPTAIIYINSPMMNIKFLELLKELKIPVCGRLQKHQMAQFGQERGEMERFLNLLVKIGSALFGPILWKQQMLYFLSMKIRKVIFGLERIIMAFFDLMEKKQ